MKTQPNEVRDSPGCFGTVSRALLVTAFVLLIAAANAQSQISKENLKFARPSPDSFTYVEHYYVLTLKPVFAQDSLKPKTEEEAKDFIKALLWKTYRVSFVTFDWWVIVVLTVGNLEAYKEHKNYAEVHIEIPPLGIKNMTFNEFKKFLWPIAPTFR